MSSGNRAYLLGPIVGLVFFIAVGFLSGCGTTDPSPSVACRDHGGVNFPGDTQYLSIPSMRIYYRTTCKDGTMVETGSNDA